MKDQTFFKFMLALQKMLIPSIIKNSLWKGWQTIIHNENGKNLGVHGFAKVLDDMQSKPIVKEGRKFITDEVKISKFHNNIPDVSKKSITPHLTDDIKYNDIVTKSEQFKVANRGANAEYTKPEYSRKVFMFTHASSTCARYPALQRRPDKCQ